MRKFLFQCGHRYYRDEDGRVFLADDVTAAEDAVEVEVTRPVTCADGAFHIPIVNSSYAIASADEAAACVSHFRMALRLGRGQWAINMTAGG